MDMQEQRVRALPFPLIKDPAVTRERKAKYGDGRYGETLSTYLAGVAASIFLNQVVM
jgi:hypothetical protein